MTQIINIRSKKKDVTKDTKRAMRCCYEQIYTNKFSDLDKKDKWENITYKTDTLRNRNLNPIFIKEINFVTKNFPQTKPKPRFFLIFPGEYFHRLKKK